MKGTCLGKQIKNKHFWKFIFVNSIQGVCRDAFLPILCLFFDLSENLLRLKRKGNALLSFIYM